mgnify:CR=1 FL=1
MLSYLSNAIPNGNDSGSDIVTNLAISALNASGARIATSVKLTIEGSSMKFSDDTTTKTVTTLTSGDLTVATKVVGAGFTNVADDIEVEIYKQNKSRR